MRRHSLVQRAFTSDLARARTRAPGLARTRTRALRCALALAALLGSSACSNYDGTARWEGVYLPESEIDRPKGVAVMDAGPPDGGADAAAADGAAADAASNGDAAPADAAPADAAQDAAPADAANGDAANGDAAAADATPAG
jgi:hypothetical protein